MNWYKISSKKYWERKIEDFKNNLREKDISKKEKNIRNKFFNYVRNQNIKITFFHGTSEALYDQMKEEGYMLPPSMMGTGHEELRKEGIDKIFFSKNIKITEFYQRQKSSQTDSKPILLYVNIPLFKIAEVQAAIFDVYTYNETAAVDDLKNIVKNDLKLLENNFDKYKDDLLKKIIDLIQSGFYVEFTTYGELKIDETQTGFKYVGNINEISKNEWIEWIKNNQIKFLDIPDYIKKELSIEDLINIIKKGIITFEEIDDNIKEEILKEISINDFDEFIENSEITWMDIPFKINMSNEKWLKLFEKRIISFYRIPNDIKKEILKEMSINDFDEFIENSEITWTDIPSDINMSNEKWFKLFKKGIIELYMIPNDIRRELPIKDLINIIEKEIITFKEIPNDIKKEILKKISINDFDEFVENSEITWMDITSDINISNEKWFKLFEKGIIEYYMIPNDIEFPEDKLIEFIENNDIDLLRRIPDKEITDEILKKISDKKLLYLISNNYIPFERLNKDLINSININEFLEFVEENKTKKSIPILIEKFMDRISIDDFAHLFDENVIKSIRFLPEYKKMQISIAKWIQWIHKRKINIRLDVPGEIIEHIPDYYWIYWIINNIIEINDMPYDILMRININEWKKIIKKWKKNGEFENKKNFIPYSIKNQIGL